MFNISLGTQTHAEGQSVILNQGLPMPMIGLHAFGQNGPLSSHIRAGYHYNTFLTPLQGEA